MMSWMWNVKCAQEDERGRHDQHVSRCVSTSFFNYDACSLCYFNLYDDTPVAQRDLNIPRKFIAQEEYVKRTMNHVQKIFAKYLNRDLLSKKKKKLTRLLIIILSTFFRAYFSPHFRLSSNTCLATSAKKKEVSIHILSLHSSFQIAPDVGWYGASRWGEKLIKMKWKSIQSRRLAWLIWQIKKLFTSHEWEEVLNLWTRDNWE